MKLRNELRNCVGLIVVTSVLVAGGAAHAAVKQPNTKLPPRASYITRAYLRQIHAAFQGPALIALLKSVAHRPFFFFPDPIYVANDEFHQFNSDLFGVVSINGGPDQPLQMQGPVETVAYGRTAAMQLGTFQTEMLSMDLTSMGGVMIRESPTRASLGETSVTDIGGGRYLVDSFFDVFTEMSLDGGQNWMVNEAPNVVTGEIGSTRVTAVPEPGSLLLAAIGLAWCLLQGRRREN